MKRKIHIPTFNTNNLKQLDVNITGVNLSQFVMIATT